MTETAVQLEQWRAQRGRGFAIGPVDLSLDPGTVLAVMGPSGIGKSTLLMTMLGYRDRDLRVSGRRSFWGAPASDGAVPDASLYIPQAVPFNPNWEVEAFLLRLPWTKGLDRTARRDRVRGVLARLDLTDRRRATIAELSGGEAQRAALAQVLLMRPRLLVGDEFVAALDPGMSLEILNASRDIVRAERGVAVFAMHSVETALAVSDMVGVFFPNPISPRPLLLRRGDETWKPDWLHALLTLSRSLTGVRAATLAPLIDELEQGPCVTGVGRPGDGVVWCGATPAPHLADRLLSRLGSEQARTMCASFDVRLDDARIVGVCTAPHASGPRRVLAAVVDEDR